MRDVLEPKGVPLLINDRVDVALAAQADGVHIGQDDMAAEDARLLLGRTAIIGLSIRTLAHVQAAPLDVLDYVAVGGIYGTTSKDTAAEPIGVAGLRDIVRAVRARDPEFPICAIAGINQSNAADVIAAGADGVAVISALSLAADPGTAARTLRGVVEAALAKRPRHDRHRAHHRRLGFERRRRHPGGPEDLRRARRLWRVRHHRADRAEHARRRRHPRRAARFHRRANRRRVLRPRHIGAVKIGMLSQGRGNRSGGARVWRATRRKNIVLDPVMVASSGDRLMHADAVGALRRAAHSARAGRHAQSAGSRRAHRRVALARNEREMEIQARQILALGARNVLIKGGHGEGEESVDLLIGQIGIGDVVRLTAPRIATANTHGTGCTLSSAIAAGLAKGRDLVSAVQDAKAYVTAAIAAADTLAVGQNPDIGHGPLHHFHAYWRTP